MSDYFAGMQGIEYRYTTAIFACTHFLLLGVINILVLSFPNSLLDSISKRANVPFSLIFSEEQGFNQTFDLYQQSIKKRYIYMVNFSQRLGKAILIGLLTTNKYILISIKNRKAVCGNFHAHYTFRNFQHFFDCTRSTEWLCKMIKYHDSWDDSSKSIKTVTVRKLIKF